MTIRIKRAYEPSADDGYRVLVDQLWPRGLSKEKAAVALWLKDIAPSDELRTWFGHAMDRWPEFREKYRGELGGQREILGHLKRLEAEQDTLTLLYAARD